MKYLILSLSIMSFLFSSCQKNLSTENTSSEKTSVEVSEVENPLLDKTSFLQKETEENTVVIDVRTPEEVQEGFIEGADLFIDYTDENFEESISKLDKNKTYIVYCRSGARSHKAFEFMHKQGFNNLFELEGGINAYNHK